MKQQPTNVRYLILMLACLTSWFLYLHRYTWSIVSEQLHKEYGFTNLQTGFLHSCFSATYGGGQIPSGIISDFFGPHLFLGGIIIVWSLAVGLLTLTGNYGVLSGAMATFGAAQAGAYPNLSKVTQSWFPQSSRTIVQGLVATFFGRGGGAMTPIIMATLLMGYAELSWRTALWIMAAGGVLFGIVFLLLFRNSPDVDPRANDAETELINEGKKAEPATRNVFPWGRAFRSPSFLLFVGQQCLNAGADVFYITYIGKYFLTAKNIDIRQAGLLLSLPLWGGAVGGVLGGFCNDFLIRVTGSRKWGRRIVGFTGKFLAFLMMFVVIRQESVVGAGLAMFFVKFFSDWSQPTVWGVCTDLGGRASATIFGILNTAGTIGGLFCPPLFGWILDNSTRVIQAEDGTTTTTDFTYLLAAVAGMYVACSLCWLFIDSSKPLDREQS